ncbi:annexin A5 [Pelomyxa schiedti]|nr:annexin A5 [Pelomyxa schiedti]
MAATTPSAEFNATAEAEVLRHALAVKGSNDPAFVRVLASRSRKQIREICAAYKELTHRDLAVDIAGDATGHCKDVLIGLVTPIEEYMAQCVREAIDRPGTNDRELIDIITQGYPEEIKLMKEAYNRLYHTSLEQDVATDTSHHFRQALIHTLNGTRMPPDHVDHSKIETDSEALFKAGEGRFGTDEDVFIDIMSRSSAAHLQAVSAHYHKHHKNHTLEHAISSETSGSFKHTLLGLCTPRPLYVAERLHDAIAGIGTNDSVLIRMFCLNEKPILHAAAGEYMRLYGETLVEAINGDTSGDYRELLVMLLR